MAKRRDKNVECEIIKKYQSGLKVKDICNEYGITYNAIYQILNRNGIYPDRATGTRRSIEVDREKEIVKLYLEDRVRTAEIAVKYSVCENTILRILRRNGIDTSRDYPIQKRG